MNPSHTPPGKHGFPWRFVRHFLIALTVLCLGHWLGTEALAGLTHALPAVKDYPLPTAGVSALGLLGLSLLLRRAHHKNPRPKTLPDRGLHFVLALGILILAFFVASSLESSVLEGPLNLHEHGLLFTLLCIIVLACIEPKLRALEESTARMVDVREIHFRDKLETPLKTLIMFVSTPSPGIALRVLNPTRQIRHPHAEITKDETTAVLQGKGHLLEDIEALQKEGIRWNWQPLMRALRGHDGLTRIILLGSKSEPAGVQGSHQYLKECAQFLALYMAGSGCLIRCHEQALDFTDFNGLVDALHALVNGEQEPPPFPIAIDVTGGQTTASIAGAAVTLGREIVFQYVDTNPPYKTMYYDVVQQPGLHPLG